MRYPNLLTQREIVRLLKHKYYVVDDETAQVLGPGRKEITPFEDDGRLFVRLYWCNKRRAISLSRLVWLSITLQPIPPKFEVHHRNENTSDNSWSNLLCIHKLDHQKLHKETEEIPF